MITIRYIILHTQPTQLNYFISTKYIWSKECYHCILPTICWKAKDWEALYNARSLCCCCFLAWSSFLWIHLILYTDLTGEDSSLYLRKYEPNIFPQLLKELLFKRTVLENISEAYSAAGFLWHGYLSHLALDRDGRGPFIIVMKPRLFRRCRRKCGSLVTRQTNWLVSIL